MDETAPMPAVSLGEALDPRSPHATEVAHAIGQALDRSGAVYITDHGISDDLLVRQFAAADALFRLPVEQRSPLVRCIVAPPDQSASIDAPWDCFEACSGKLVSRDGEHAAIEFRGDAPAWLADATAHYAAAMSRLSQRLLQLLALSLDEPTDAFHADDAAALGVLRMLSYPPPAQGSGDAGAHAHTDRCTLTVLAQDGHAGLEVQDDDGRWARVLPRAGALLFHPGDALAVTSGGRYRALPHRVRRSPGHSTARLSLPFFYTPLTCGRAGR